MESKTLKKKIDEDKDNYEKLLESNRMWAEENIIKEPLFFSKLKITQQPKYLWIGCSDSRVPAEDIIQVNPGELFVHRNLSNVFVATDLNAVSVLEYAVDVLKVNHIIVCGHYDCKGVEQALSHDSHGMIDRWLKNIKDVYVENYKELSQYSNEKEKLLRLVEMNVIHTAKNLLTANVVQKNWKNRNAPYIHAWIYDTFTGLVNNVLKIKPNDDKVLNHIYYFKF